MESTNPTLEATLEELTPRLLRYCLGRSADRGLAEDVAQETLVALVQRWRRLGPPESVEAFVFSIARRRMARATHRLLRFRPLEALVAQPMGEAQAEPDPERSSAAKDELATALEAIGGLRPKLKEALLLTAAAGLDGATAARVLGISDSAFKMRLSRAREKLRDSWNSKLKPALRKESHDSTRTA